MLKTLNASAADSWCGCLQPADTAVAWVTVYRDNAGADSALSYLGYNTAVFCTLCSSQATALLGDIMQSGHDYYIDIFNFRHQIFFCARCWLIVIHDWADEQTWDQLLGVSSLAAITQPDTHLTHILHTHTLTHNSAKWDTQRGEGWQKYWQKCQLKCWYLEEILWACGQSQ